MTASGAATTRLLEIGRALRHRNYRLFFSGQSVSLIGTWLTRVATSWLIYRLTGSALLLGVLGFAGQLPTFLLAPLAGVLVDRWNRYHVLVVTQILAMVQSALLAGLALGGVIQIWHIVALSVFQALINAFDVPARHALVSQMVADSRDLPNAIALNSSMVNAPRLIGPAVAGLLIAAVGEGFCFFVDAASYLAVVTSLLLMRIVPLPARSRSTRVLAEMTAGFRYAAESVPIRAVLLLLAAVSLTGIPYAVLLPVIAREVLGGGAGTLGALTAASGLGALVGALYLASRSSALGVERVIAVSSILFGLGLVGFSRAHVLWLALPLLLLTGAGMMLLASASTTLLQSVVEEDKRGRVMSLFSMAYFGALPFGSLLAGVFATRLGAQNTILIGGVACLVSAAIFFRALPALERAVEPLYAERGILPATPKAETKLA